MNNPEAPLRWRIAATIGPEQVALALTIALALVMLLAIGLRGSPRDETLRPTAPAASPAASEASRIVLSSWLPWPADQAAVTS